MKNEDEEEEDVKIKVETEPDEDIEGEEKMEEGGAEQEENGNPALHRLFRKIAYIARKPGNDERVLAHIPICENGLVCFLTLSPSPLLV